MFKLIKSDLNHEWIEKLENMDLLQKYQLYMPQNSFM